MKMMSKLVKRSELERWLLRNGFEKVNGRSGGHAHFKSPRLTVTVMSHGPKELTKKHTAMIRRSLLEAGYSPEW